MLSDGMCKQDQRFKRIMQHNTHHNSQQLRLPLWSPNLNNTIHTINSLPWLQQAAALWRLEHGMDEGDCREDEDGVKVGPDAWAPAAHRGYDLLESGLVRRISGAPSSPQTAAVAPPARVLDLRSFNDSLLVIWWQKFSSQYDCLLSRIITERYFKRRPISSLLGWGGHDRSNWRTKICSSSDCFLSFIR